MDEGPTEADRVLIAAMDERGISGVTWRKLKRWRSKGLLPHRSREPLQRGRGTTSADDPEAVDQLEALCGWLERYPRKLNNVAISLWYEGWQVATDRIRSVALSAVEALEATGQREIETAPFMPFEKAAAPFIRHPERDPAGENPRASQRLRDARSDFYSSITGNPEYSDNELLADFFHVSRYSEEQGGYADPGEHVRGALADVNVTSIRQAILRSSDEDLERARALLQALYELPDEVERLIPAESMPPETPLESLQLTPADFDTRSANYDPDLLKVGLAVSLALIAAKSEKPQ